MSAVSTSLIMAGQGRPPWLSTSCRCLLIVLVKSLDSLIVLPVSSLDWPQRALRARCTARVPRHISLAFATTTGLDDRKVAHK